MLIRRLGGTMVRYRLILLPLLVAATPAAATDFGVRVVGQAVGRASGGEVVRAVATRFSRGVGDLGEAVAVAARYGRITSTLRSTEHNRAVGGVPNSYHLRGMAIDVVRRGGVAHWQIAAALREAGLHLIESLDEGDHSHFAFGHGGSMAPVERRPVAVIPHEPENQTNWGIVELRSARGAPTG